MKKFLVQYLFAVFLAVTVGPEVYMTSAQPAPAAHASIDAKWSPIPGALVYSLTCASNTDTVRYENHRPVPDALIFTMNVRNAGREHGRDVACYIQLPPGVHLASRGGMVQSIDSLAVGETVVFRWELQILPTYQADTLVICGRLSDVYDNQETCCDSVFIVAPAIPNLEVSCQSPDTIYADNRTGTYKNSPFRVSLHVRNVHEEEVDSLRATILIQAPSMIPERKSVYAEQDTTSPEYHVVFSWLMDVMPIAYAHNARICFFLDVPSGERFECCRDVHVQGFTPQGFVSPPLAAEDNLQAFNAPNPFNSTTLITYHVPRAERVVVTVFDMLGRTAAILSDRFVESGTHVVRYNPSALLPGVYFYRVSAGPTSVTGRMLLMK